MQTSRCNAVCGVASSVCGVVPSKGVSGPPCVNNVSHPPTHTHSHTRSHALSFSPRPRHTHTHNHPNSAFNAFSSERFNEREKQTNRQTKQKERKHKQKVKGRGWERVAKNAASDSAPLLPPTGNPMPVEESSFLGEHSPASAQLHRSEPCHVQSLTKAHTQSMDWSKMVC